MRKIVIVNQAANYLTIGICNAFVEKAKQVSIITGSLHVQGEALSSAVDVHFINKWVERPASKKMLSYLWACLNIWILLLTKYRKHEVFFISIPPMAYLLNLIVPNRFSMLIWDVYPDIFKVTGMRESHLVYRIWSGLNKRSFQKAWRVFTIGEQMSTLLEQYVEKNKIIISPIWSIFQENKRTTPESNPFIKEHALEGKFIVQYSGNIGLTHNVELMVKLADRMSAHADILFQIIGRGPRVPELKKMVEERKLENCSFLPFQSDEMFPHSLSAANIGVVILDKTTSKGSVPSKSYNLMSYGIPSLYIASKDSELQIYADRYNHAFCTDHDNLEQAAAFILKLKEDEKTYYQYSMNAEKASENYRRDNADRLIELYFR